MHRGCLGCCWALFTVLVAAGAMSLAWMLALTLADSAEKTLPLGRSVAYVIGVAGAVQGTHSASGVLDHPAVAHQDQWRTPTPYDADRHDFR